MRVIGMISGTSYDAIEAVALEMELVGATVSAELRGHVSAPYPPAVRDLVASVLPPAATTIEDVCRIDTLVGQSFASVAVELAATAFGGEADVVCSHGQTVFHWVDAGRARGTLQLGQAAWIAEATGATVVTDVRSRDVASGGHGAPLASLLDVMVLGAHPSTVRAALNLGGIANITAVGPDAEPVAFDIGPANALIDAAVRMLSGGTEEYDRDGRRATRGEVDRALLDVLLDDPYYARPAPKSTGKEHFHLGYLLERLDGHEVAPDDLVATLTALTAETVARSVAELGVVDLVVSGGGTRNPALMDALARLLPAVAIAPIDVLGIPEQAKEAVVFALVGLLTVHGIAGNVPSCTGAAHSAVLGAVVPGRQRVVELREHERPTTFVMVRPTGAP